MPSWLSARCAAPVIGRRGLVGLVQVVLGGGGAGGSIRGGGRPRKISMGGDEQHWLSATAAATRVVRVSQV